jgi:hypothetical protein
MAEAFTHPQQDCLFGIHFVTHATQAEGIFLEMDVCIYQAGQNDLPSHIFELGPLVCSQEFIIA